jgi:hypothetical protein
MAVHFTSTHNPTFIFMHRHAILNAHSVIPSANVSTNTTRSGPQEDAECHCTQYIKQKVKFPIWTSNLVKNSQDNVNI